MVGGAGRKTPAGQLRSLRSWRVGAGGGELRCARADAPGSHRGRGGITTARIAQRSGVPPFFRTNRQRSCHDPRLSLDHHPHQDPPPVHAAAEGRCCCALPAGGAFLQCHCSAPGPALQQPGPLGAANTDRPRIERPTDRDLFSTEERVVLNLLRKNNRALSWEKVPFSLTLTSAAALPAAPLTTLVRENS